MQMPRWWAGSMADGGELSLPPQASALEVLAPPTCAKPSQQEEVWSKSWPVLLFGVLKVDFLPPPAEVRQGHLLAWSSGGSWLFEVAQ